MKSPVVSFSILSAKEGGIGLKLALKRLKSKGIKAFPWITPYVGHVGIGIRTHNKRVIGRAQRILFA